MKNILDMLLIENSFKILHYNFTMPINTKWYSRSAQLKFQNT